MKHIKLFENFNHSALLINLKNYGFIRNFTINDDGTIDVDGNVDLSDRRLKKIPFKFGKVTGNFYCYNNQLNSLKGSPVEIGGSFNCNNNDLLDLNFSPIEVGGYFKCCDNEIVSLKGMPLEIGDYFDCRNNPKLKKLDSISNIEGDIFCDSHTDISVFSGFSKSIDNTYKSDESEFIKKLRRNPNFKGFNFED